MQTSRKMYYTTKRMKGVEPSSPAWKAGVIAVIRHPRMIKKIPLIDMVSQDIS